KTLIKDHTSPGTDLGTVFSEVNNILCDSNSEGLFITAFEGVLNLKTGEFRYVNAGHEPPFISHGGDNFDAFKIKPGFVLAGMEGMKYTSGVITLSPGDKLFQYTDGVTEATNSENELYGMERLEAALNKVKDKMPEDILPAIKEDMDAFVGDAPQFDDITMLCLNFKKYREDGE
ncbi:MAG: serine/threonine-protein phosphatase, partial [Eubacterium sp.]|nr:serine/threonine-protein phosphatase [Eubacterium sp.]